MRRIENSLLKRVLMCLAFLGVCWTSGAGQVMIVQDKARTSRPANSGKGKKNKVKSSGAQSPAAVESGLQTNSNLKAARQEMAFVVVPPKLQTVPSFNFRLTNAAMNPSSKMVNYVFDVITADSRGRVTERRQESARYFREDLTGGIGIDLVEIPGGAFMMGSSDADLTQLQTDYVHSIEREIKTSLLRRVPWEAPQHMVKVPGFYLSKFEITQAQWRAVAGLPKVSRDLMSDPSHFKGSNRPVEKISWEDAMEFCERLSRAIGRRYRLPTEAEWEYAARAGTNSPYSFGDSMTADWANYQGKFPYGVSPKGAYREQTVAVGSLGVANAFGLYDMHGNVWEWCLDTWHEGYQSAPENGRPWEGGGLMYLKMLRGGGWDSVAGECRSSARNKMTSTIRLNNIGFRVVAEVSGQLASN